MRRARRRERRRHGHVPLVGLRRGVCARDAVAREVEAAARLHRIAQQPRRRRLARTPLALARRAAAGELAEAIADRRGEREGEDRHEPVAVDVINHRWVHQDISSCALHTAGTPASQGALFFIAMLLVTASLGRVRFPHRRHRRRALFGNFVELRGGALPRLTSRSTSSAPHLLADDPRCSATTSWSSRCWTNASNGPARRAHVGVLAGPSEFAPSGGLGHALQRCRMSDRRPRR